MLEFKIFPETQILHEIEFCNSELLIRKVKYHVLVEFLALFLVMIDQNQKFRASKMVKMPLFESRILQNLISRNIWRADKFFNIHTVWEMLSDFTQNIIRL